jgi:hypothetical protein
MKPEDVSKQLFFVYGNEMQKRIKLLNWLRKVSCTYHTVPYRTAPHRTVPHRTVPYRTVPHRTVPYRTVPYRTAPHRTVPHRTVPHRTAPHRTVYGRRESAAKLGTSASKSMLTPRRETDDSIKMGVTRNAAIGSICDSFGSRQGPVTESSEYCP